MKTCISCELHLDPDHQSGRSPVSPPRHMSTLVKGMTESVNQPIPLDTSREEHTGSVHLSTGIIPYITCECTWLCDGGACNWGYMKVK